MMRLLHRHWLRNNRIQERYSTWYQSWAFATFFPIRYSLIRYFNVAIRYRYSATFQKGVGIFLHVLHVYYSFHQKCSKLDTFTA
jgi:hypothetical protein